MDSVITWLLDGDVSIQYQTQRDLLGNNNIKLQQRILTEGWGKRYLDLRHDNGHRGQGFYRPKWTLTHYTLLDLKHLNISQTVCRFIRQKFDPQTDDAFIVKLGL